MPNGSMRQSKGKNTMFLNIKLFSNLKYMVSMSTHHGNSSVIKMTPSNLYLYSKKEV